MAKSGIRKGVYEPPSSDLPYVALVIDPQGKQHLKTFPTRAAAEDHVNGIASQFVTQFSVIGKALPETSRSKG